MAELRPIHEIARDIHRNWSTQGKGVNYAAKPYLDAMRSLSTTADHYGMDDGDSVVSYFLGNATSYRGEAAKGHKAELKAHLKATPPPAALSSRQFGS